MIYSYLLYPNFKKKALTLSYDDGVVQDRRFMKILDNFGIKCTFNINSAFMQELNGNVKIRMTDKEISELYTDTVHEVALHGERHFPLSEMPKEVIIKEIVADRERLEKLLGRIVKGMAYAYGSTDDRTVEILKMCGIKYSRTVKSSENFSIPSDWLRLSPTCHHNNPKLFELADKFLEETHEEPYYSYRTGPSLFYLWGHAYEFDNDNNWGIIEKFAEKMGKRDDIWYCTNGEFYDYIKAFESLEYSLQGDIVHNPSCLPVYYNNRGKYIVIKPGETVSLGYIWG